LIIITIRTFVRLLYTYVIYVRLSMGESLNLSFVTMQLINQKKRSDCDWPRSLIATIYDQVDWRKYLLKRYLRKHRGSFCCRILRKFFHVRFHAAERNVLFCEMLKFWSKNILSESSLFDDWQNLYVLKRFKKRFKRSQVKSTNYIQI